MISDAYVHHFLDAIFNGTTLTALSNRYLSYHTADPGATGANEVSGGSYARQDLNDFGAAASRQTDNAATEQTTMPEVTATHFGVWDHITNTAAANFVWGGPLNADAVFALDDTADLAISDLVVKL